MPSSLEIAKKNPETVEISGFLIWRRTWDSNRAPLLIFQRLLSVVSFFTSSCLQKRKKPCSIITNNCRALSGRLYFLRGAYCVDDHGVCFRIVVDRELFESVIRGQISQPDVILILVLDGAELDHLAIYLCCDSF